MHSDRCETIRNERLPINIEQFAREISIQQDWGQIAKGAEITQFFAHDVTKIRRRLHIHSDSHSVALGIMEPNAYHHPYIRHASPTTTIIDKQCTRVYRIVEGSFQCVRNGELLTCTPESGYIVVNEYDIFSFKAGREGCVFGIMDFPAFSPHFDVNNITCMLNGKAQLS